MFLDAAQAGAKLGLENQGQHNQAAEALGKLGLGYAENASRSNLAAAELAAHAKAAANALLLNQNKLGELADYRNKMVDYRSRENDIREQGIAAKEAAAALGKTGEIHAGNKVIKRRPDGSYEVVFDAGASELDPLDRVEFGYAQKRKSEAEQHLKTGKLPPGEAGMWNQQLKEANDTLTNIRERRPGAKLAPTAAAFAPTPASATPDAQAPFGNPVSLSPWDALSPQNGSSPPFINTQEQPGPTPATRMRYNPETKELEPH